MRDLSEKINGKYRSKESDELKEKDDIKYKEENYHENPSDLQQQLKDLTEKINSQQNNKNKYHKEHYHNKIENIRESKKQKRNKNS